MRIAFCASCGFRNLRTSIRCTNCGSDIHLDTVSSRQWEVINPSITDDVVDADRRSVFRRHPIISSSVLTIAALLVFVGWWMVIRETRPPCVEFASSNCSPLVLARPLATSESSTMRSPSDSVWTRLQAETADWVRILALTAAGPGTPDLNGLFDVVAGQDTDIGPCLTLRDCLEDAQLGEIDYDGLSGSLGLTRDGIPKRAVFETTSSQSIQRRLVGTAVDNSSLVRNAGLVIDEIRIISENTDLFGEVEPVVAELRAELESVGITLTLSHVLREQDSDGDASTIELHVGTFGSIGRRALHLGSPRVLLVAKDDRGTVHRMSFEVTESQVVDAVQSGLKESQTAVLLVSCREVAIGEFDRTFESGVRVVSRCVSDLSRIQRLEESIDFSSRLVVIGSMLESQLADSLASLPTSAETYILRLN